MTTPGPAPDSHSPHPNMSQDVSWGLLLAGFGLITLFYFLIRLNLIDIPLNRDEGCFGFFGRLIAQGGTIYKDGFDHKPPGTWWIYALFYYLAPFTAKGLHWAVHVYNFITLMVLGGLVRKLFGWSTAFWACLLFAVLSVGGDVEGFSTSSETLMLLPIVLSYLLVFIGLDRQSSALLFAGGLPAAVAFWIKQPAAAFFAFLMLVVIFRNRDWRASVKYVLAFSAGFLIFSAALLAYFYIAGTWREFYYWSFSHNLEYTGTISFQEAAGFFRRQARDMISGNPLAWVAAVGTLMILPVKSFKKGMALIGFFLTSLVASSHSPSLYPHYFILLCPALALTAGIACAKIQSFGSLTEMKGKLLFIGLLLCMGALPLWLGKAYFFTDTPVETARRHYVNQPFPESITAADYLKAHTRPGDTLMVLGSEPQILLLAERKSATRFPMLYPLFGPYRRAPEFQKQVLQDLVSHSPRYVVLVTVWESWLKYPDSGDRFFQIVNKILGTSYWLEGAVIPDGKYGKLVTAKDAKTPLPNDTYQRASMLLFRKKT